ncbi:MAG: RNA polymerase sigma factor [Phycisphaerae bacterium]
MIRQQSTESTMMAYAGDNEAQHERGDSDHDSLLSSAISGDEAALQRMLMRSHRRLSSHLEAKLPTGLRKFVSVDDVLQETYLAVFKKIHSFQPRGDGSFHRWLVTIAENQMIDAIKSERAAKRGGDFQRLEAPADRDAQSVVEYLELLATNERTPSRHAAGQEALQHVEQALQQLKNEHREALQLRYLEGLSVKEVAARMNRTEGAVCLLCHRALRRLQDMLGNATRFFSRGV